MPTVPTEYPTLPVREGAEEEEEPAAEFSWERRGDWLSEERGKSPYKGGKGVLWSARGPKTEGMEGEGGFGSMEGSTTSIRP